MQTKAIKKPIKQLSGSGYFEAHPEALPSVKVGFNGLTVLHNHRYQTRYKGSKSLKVTASGILEKKPLKQNKEQTGQKEIPVRKYRVNKSEISKRIQAMINVQSGKKSLFFYTISFPNQVSDNTAYKILNSFLTTMRTANGFTQYLWICERNRQGTIHFHIASPELYKPKHLNGIIVNLLHHYIRKGQLNWSHSAAAKYNGLDLAKDRTTRKITNFAAVSGGKKLSAYLTKYCGKGKESFSRQAWQASKVVSSFFTEILVTTDEAELYIVECIDRDNPVFIDTHFCYYKYLKSPPAFALHFLQKINADILKISVN